MFELGQLLRDGVDEQFHRVLVHQPVTATDGIVEVVFDVIVILDHARGATLGGTGVAAHGIDLRDQSDLEARILLRHRDRRAQARTACSDDRNVRLDYFHTSTTPRLCRPHRGRRADTTR